MGAHTHCFQYLLWISYSDTKMLRFAILVALSVQVVVGLDQSKYFKI